MKQELSLFIPVYGMTTKFTKEFVFFFNGGYMPYNYNHTGWFQLQWKVLPRSVVYAETCFN